MGFIDSAIHPFHLSLAVFADENFIPLRHLAQRHNNVVRWTEFEHGGHFAAREQPD
jgi:pimeloyl-ACP methyl ester carboxylesterase